MSNARRAFRVRVLVVLLAAAVAFSGLAWLVHLIKGVRM